MSIRRLVQPAIVALLLCLLLLSSRDAAALPQVIALKNFPIGASDVAVDPLTDRIYVSFGAPIHEVRVYSANGDYLDSIPAFINGIGGGLEIDPFDKRLYVGGLQVKAFDTETYQLVDESPLPPGSDGWTALNDGTGRLYTAEVVRYVRVFDSATLALLQEIDLGATQSRGISIDVYRNKVYVLNTVGVYSIDGTNNIPTLLYQSPASLSPSAIAVSSRTGRVFVGFEAGANSIIHVIDPSDGGVIAEIPIENPTLSVNNGEGIEADPASDVVYVNDGQYITRIDGSTLETLDRLRPHEQWSEALDFAFNGPDGRVYVVDSGQFLATLAELPVGGGVDLPVRGDDGRSTTTTPVVLAVSLLTISSLVLLRFTRRAKSSY